MLNISFRYYTAFSFQLLHEYYPEEQTEDILLIPSPESMNKAKRLGMIFKQTKNQLKLHYEEDKVDILHSLSPEELRFSFFIYSKNIYFNNFTQLPVESPEGKILYFTNKNKTKIISESDVVSERDFINTAEIKDTFPSEHPIKKPIAFVEIWTGENPEKFFSSSHTQPEALIDYSVKFPARKTYWKYAIVSQYRNLDQQAEVVSTDGLAPNFSRKENETLLNKQEAAIFISNEPMILKQRPEFSLRLTQKDKASKSVEIIPRLPTPTVEMIKPESRSSNAKIYSEITVYI